MQAHITRSKKMSFSFTNKTALNSTGTQNLKYVMPNFYTVRSAQYASKFSVNLVAQNLLIK